MRVCLLLACLGATACASLAPRISEDASSRALLAYEDLSGILARAELGQYRRPASHADALDTYVTIITRVETAAFAVATAPAAGPAMEARDALGRLISACVEQVRLLSDLHRDFGITPASGATQPVRVTCDAATRALASGQ